MPSWLGPFIVFDIFVTLIVVAVVTKKLKFNVNIKVNSSGSIDLKGMTAFAKDEHGKIGDYLRANFSGQPEQLMTVLEALLEQLDSDAKSRGLTFDRRTLKALLAGSVRGHHVVKPKELDEALEKLAA